jgi:serine/threonine protein kinase
MRDWMERDDPNAAQRCLAADLDSYTCWFTIFSSYYAGSRLTPPEKDFLKACVAKDPKQRWTAEKLLQHRYITQ